MTDKNDNSTEQARRRLLKTIAGAGGVITAGKMLPDNWKRPIVDTALLPAHAQTSTCTEPCALNVSILWGSNGLDFDLLLETPGGTTIDPKGTQQSQCLQHDGDNDGNTATAESISTIGSGVNPGTYRMFVRNPSGGEFINYTVSGCGNNIASNANPPNGTTLLETFTVPGP